MCFFSAQLARALIVGLSLGSKHATERAALYPAEDPEITDERKDLMQHRESLDGVVESFVF